MIKQNKNIVPAIAVFALSAFCIAGCSHNAASSAQYSKNFKPTGVRTPEVNKQIAAGIADFYKKHPQYNQSGSSAPPSTAPSTQ